MSLSELVNFTTSKASKELLGELMRDWLACMYTTVVSSRRECLEAIGHAYLPYADDLRTISWPRMTRPHQGARERTWLCDRGCHSLHPAGTPAGDRSERRL